MKIVLIILFLSILNSWTGILVLVLAKVAFILSIIAIRKSNKIAKNDFILSHRPFVWAENTENHSMNEVILKVINAPAKILRQFYSYYTIDNQGNRFKIEEIEINNNEIKYPDRLTPYIQVSPMVDHNVIQKLKSDQELERMIEIDYSWLSSKKNFAFKSKSRFDKESKNWKSLNQEAN